jgi:hypothetical protein
VTDSSRTSLTTKLGIKVDSRLALLDAPAGLDLDLPAGVAIRRQARGNADVVLAFFTRATKVESRLDRLAPMVFPAGGLWIAWPKKTSGVATDITDGAVRAMALHRGLVDNKVCAVDATWTALRLVWRRQHRTSERRPS